jgi:Tol biopolymer transport system component
MLFAAILGISGCAALTERNEDPSERETSSFLSNTRQLTFEGRRTGEGYFDATGRDIVFQSEREPGNPFYQIYRMDLESGYAYRVSTGIGKTTCAWIHPDGERVLYASTHLDPDARVKQEKEFTNREAGTQHRYAWDYDPNYDLFVAEPGGGITRLTSARGYDAEASFSPDGRWVAFASNRHAFQGALEPADRERLAENPQHFIDLYLLDTESGEIRALTNHEGYDGGPFFSPDGERVVWRRFSEDGARAEIHTIRLDGTDERVLTHLGVMSWAPYFHPSGDYLVFNTNLHGFANFELYIVDAEGQRDPVRVTTSDGFDALGVFSPRGDELLWTSTRTADGKSQLFLADWDNAAARRALGLTQYASGSLPISSTDPDITPADLATHVAALTDVRTEGRGTGSLGEQVAAEYIARSFEAADL